MFPSGSELLVILLAILVLFGGKGISDIAKNIGRGVREIKKTTNDLKREMESEPEKPDSDLKG
ncbi:MAG: twin-arginine translocase TatA/TatE family subunit [bacterium]